MKTGSLLCVDCLGVGGAKPSGSAAVALLGWSIAAFATPPLPCQQLGDGLWLKGQREGGIISAQKSW